jgi:hypothetical protein
MEEGIMPKGKGYSVTVGGKTYKITVPKFLQRLTTPDVERTPGLARSKNAPSREFKNVAEANQLEQLDNEMKNVGRTEMEREIFDD